LINTVFYENETEKEFEGINAEELCETLLNEALSYLKCEYDCECNLLITDLIGIHDMNREIRGIDRPTDVLSFPMIDFTSPCDYDCIDEEDVSIFNPESGRLMLGDIVICYDKVIEQAAWYGHSVKREFSFLILHSILHLFGYDHMTDEERIVMEGIQRDILNNLNITRD